MKKISLLLIFCFLFQGCFLSFVMIGDVKDESRRRASVGKSKICNFKEVVSQISKDNHKYYTNRFLLTGSLLDVGLNVYYFITFNPNGLALLANGVYSFYAGFYLRATLSEIYAELYPINIFGWYQINSTECKEEYFGFLFESREQLIQTETLFLKAILNYPPYYDISQDQNFSNFQKDFLPNNKIQTYSKDNSFYRYIHYPGGKAKFEEDFGKYMYKQQK